MYVCMYIIPSFICRTPALIGICKTQNIIYIYIYIALLVFAILVMVVGSGCEYVLLLLKNMPDLCLVLCGSVYYLCASRIDNRQQAIGSKSMPHDCWY